MFGSKGRLRERQAKLRQMMQALPFTQVHVQPTQVDLWVSATSLGAPIEIEREQWKYAGHNRAAQEALDVAAGFWGVFHSPENLYILKSADEDQSQILRFGPPVQVHSKDHTWTLIAVATEGRLVKEPKPPKS